MRGLSASARAGHRRVQSPNRPGRPRTRKTPNGGGQKKRGRPTKEQLLIAAADRAASASRFRSLLVGASTNERTTTASPSTGRSSDTSSAKPMRAIRRSLERNRQVSSRPAMANANQLSRSTTTPDASPTSSDRGTSEQILFLSSIVSSTRLGPGATLEYQGSSVPNDIRVNSAKFTGLLSACGTSATDVELFVVRCGGACFFESAALAANISTSSLKTRILNTLRSSDKMEQLFEALRPVGNGSVFISENGNVWTGDTFSDFFAKCKEIAANISTNLSTDSSGKWFANGIAWGGSAFMLGVLAVTLSSSVVQWDAKSNNIFTFHPCGKVEDGACKLGDDGASMVLIFNGKYADDRGHYASLRIASAAPSSGMAKEAEEVCEDGALSGHGSVAHDAGPDDEMQGVRADVDPPPPAVNFDDFESTDTNTEAMLGTYMLDYGKAIVKRLQFELSSRTDPDEPTWLLKLLKRGEHDDYGWWIERHEARQVCEKLGLFFSEVGYYRRVHVWIPDVRWSEKLPSSDTPIGLPPCPHCKTNVSVGAHGFHDQHFGRCIIGLTDWYLSITRRYICHSCSKVAQEVRSGDEATAAPAYTWMGWDERSLDLMPFGLGSQYPALLTHRNGIDMMVCSLMRPLFHKGLRPAGFTKMLEELHAKEHSRRHLHREFQLLLQRRRFVSTEWDVPNVPFASFGDPKFGAKIASAKYIMSVYLKCFDRIKQHLEMEVKKRGAEELSIDASYKEAKCLAKFKGEQMFSALITATNEHREIRAQFHVVSDSHPQMKKQLQAMQSTMTMHGQPETRVVKTDNPARDKAFYLNLFPGVAERQRDLDRAVGIPTAPRLPKSSIAQSSINVPSSAMAANTAVRAMASIVAAQDTPVVAIDCEWDTRKDRRGHVVWSGSVAVIQLGWIDSLNNDDGSEAQAIVIQMNGRSTLHPSLLDLFTNPEILFIGRGVSADLKKIARDFKCPRILAARTLDLAVMAAKRGLVRRATCSMRFLVATVLGRELSKDATTRLSKWSSRRLTDLQREYAALDVTEAILMYNKMASMSDLTKRLTPPQAVAERTVTIVPRFGSIAVMASAVGRARICDQQTLPTRVINGTRRHAWQAPSFAKPTWISARSNRPMRLVEVQTVKAAGQALSFLKHKTTGRVVTIGDIAEQHIEVVRRSLEHSRSTDVDAAVTKMTNGDFTDHPFQLFLPITMLTVDRGPRAPSFPIDESTSDIRSDEPQIFGETDLSENDDFPDASSSDEGGLRADDIQQVQEALVTVNNLTRPSTDPKLGPVPERIQDKYSAVQGDAFHYFQRLEVPRHHSARKSFKVAFREALFVWDPVAMRIAKEALLKYEDMPETSVDSMLFYRAEWFKMRVPRSIPPPSLLYLRMYKVFKLFGHAADKTTGNPLFNDKVWNAACNFLKEILEGHVSDHPFVAYYRQRLNRDGSPMLGPLGLPLLDCIRGTNLTENVHKQIMTSFGSWNVGTRVADALLAEFRHRYNHDMSQRTRPMFPTLGHYDTWEVDKIQQLVEENHGILLYPGWSNAEDYACTPEQFGTVALHSEELDLAIKECPDPPDDHTFTEEEAYICKCMGTKYPIVPVQGVYAKKLFRQLVARGADNDSAMDQLAIDWCKHVDVNKCILPTNPAYLRRQLKKWKASDNHALTVRNLETNGRLQALRHELEQSGNYHAAHVAVGSQPSQDDQIQFDGVFPVSQYRSMVVPASSEESQTTMSLDHVSEEVPQATAATRTFTKRGSDRQKRRRRRCMRCIEYGLTPEEARECPGNRDADLCLYII